MNQYEERLYEIKFFDLVNKFVRNSNANHKVYDFMELLSEMTGSDYLMLRSATKRCIMNEFLIRPSKHEVVVLYSKLDYGVRPLCRKMGMNTGSYYYIMKQYEAGDVNITPRFPEKERAAILKMILQLTNLLKILD